jgi:hypothetical protein
MVLFVKTKVLNMKRIGAGLLALSFIVGVLIVPMVHRAHCTDNHDAHEVAKCSICQFTHTPIITTASVIAPIAGFIKLGDVVLPQSFIASSPWRDPTQARAPPCGNVPSVVKIV